MIDEHVNISHSVAQSAFRTADTVNKEEKWKTKQKQDERKFVLIDDFGKAGEGLYSRGRGVISHLLCTSCYF